MNIKLPKLKLLSASLGLMILGLGMIPNLASAAADFKVTNISLIPESPEAGVRFKAKITVKNRGSTAGDAGQLTVWKNKRAIQSCNADGNKSAAVGTLAIGESKVITFRLKASEGDKKLRAFVDSGCSANEPNEDNNQLGKAYTVIPKLPPSASVLLRKRDLAYQGAFRLPNDFDMGWATGRIGYSPERDSLFFVARYDTQEVIEMSIPAPVVSTRLRDFHRATLLNGPQEPSEGLLAQLGVIGEQGGSGILIGGLLPYGDRLLGTGYEQYDAEAQVTRSHWVRPIDLSALGEAQGMFLTDQLAGRVGGYLGLIPGEWQSLLGGEVFSGLFGVSVISRSSYGPAAFSMHPADLGQVEPIPLSPLVYYPQEHPKIGDWPSDYDATAGVYFNGTTRFAGAVFPSGSGSLLFFGVQGLGPFCYGDTYSGVCEDSAYPGQGTHAYPYAYHVWAYAAADFVRVRSGALKPWQVSPYAVWTFNLPFAIEARSLEGVAYDAVGNRLFLAQGFGDRDSPLIHVFSVN